MPDEEDSTTTTPRKRRGDSAATEYPASELISLSMELANCESHSAAGALRAADIPKEGKLTVAEFKKICEDYRKVKAF